MKHSSSMGYLAAGLVAAASFVFAADKPATRPAKQAANTYCPIETGNKIDKTTRYEYKGKVVGFCCPECIDEFKKDPDKYIDKLK